jgi:hypothetical protein
MSLFFSVIVAMIILFVFFSIVGYFLGDEDG